MAMISIQTEKILSKRAREPLNQSAAALSGPFAQLIGLKTLKYTKYSCDFQTSIWNKIPR